LEDGVAPGGGVGDVAFEARGAVGGAVEKAADEGPRAGVVFAVKVDAVGRADEGIESGSPPLPGFGKDQVEGVGVRVSVGRAEFEVARKSFMNPGGQVVVECFEGVVDGFVAEEAEGFGSAPLEGEDDDDVVALSKAGGFGAALGGAVGAEVETALPVPVEEVDADGLPGEGKGEEGAKVADGFADGFGQAMGFFVGEVGVEGGAGGVAPGKVGGGASGEEGGDEEEAGAEWAHGGCPFFGLW